jgi:flagellar biosynthesis/type III secretory pathway M-ring protein FliF/YscJ
MRVNHWFVISLFLYFPEDKTEYIPAAITSFVFLIAAIFTMRFIIKVSKKEAQKAKEYEQAVMNQMEEHKENS